MLLTVGHNVSFLHDLAIVMIVAGLVTILFPSPQAAGGARLHHRGRHHRAAHAAFPADRATKKRSNTLSELGIIFLMFSLGLEFSLRKLKEVGATAFIAAIDGHSRHALRRLFARPGCSAGARWTAFSSARSSPFPPPRS